MPELENTSSAAVADTSASVDTSAAVSAAVDTSAASSATESSAASSSVDTSNLSDFDFISKKLAEITKPEEEAKPAETTEAAPEGETKPDDATAEKPAEGAEKPAEEVKPEEDKNLDYETIPSVKELAEKIKGNEELDKALEAAGLKNTVFKLAREANEVAKFKEIFPDADAAKEAATHAVNWREADQAFLSGPQDFASALLKMATITDDSGQPKIGANGYVEVAPQLTTFLDYVGQQELTHKFTSLRKEAETEDNAELLAALDIITERISPNRAAASDEVPEHLKAREAAVQAKEQAFTRQEAAQQQQAFTRFENEVETEIDSKISPVVENLLANVALTTLEKKQITSDIEEALVKNLAANPDYTSRLAQLEKMPLTPDAKSARVAHAVRYSNAVLGDIVRKAIAGAGKAKIQAQQQKDTKIAAQQQASKADPQGSKAPATPMNLDGKALVTHVETQLKSELGREPSMSEIIAASLKYQEAQRKAAR